MLVFEVVLLDVVLVEVGVMEVDEVVVDVVEVDVDVGVVEVDVLVDVVLVVEVEVLEVDEVVVVVVPFCSPSPLESAPPPPPSTVLFEPVAGGGARFKARAWANGDGGAGDASTKTAKESRSVTSEKMVRTRPARVVEQRIVGEFQMNVMSSKARDGFCRRRRRCR